MLIYFSFSKLFELFLQSADIRPAGISGTVSVQGYIVQRVSGLFAGHFLGHLGPHTHLHLICVIREHVRSPYLVVRATPPHSYSFCFRNILPVLIKAQMLKTVIF